LVAPYVIFVGVTLNFIHFSPEVLLSKMVKNGERKKNRGVNARAKRAPRMPRNRRGPAVAINNNTRSQPAKLNTTSKGTVVSHIEIIKESLNNSVAFAVSDVFTVQPALTAYSHGSPLGAWLAGVAKEYDNYEFTTLKVHYKTTCSSLTDGQVVMAYDPNPDGTPPATFQSARNSAKCVTGPVRENVSLDLSSHVTGKKLLTRTGAVSAYPNYDAGRFIIATSSGVNTNAVGFVEIEYVIRLFNPQTSPGIDVSSNFTLTNKEQRVWNAGSNVDYFGTTAAQRNATAVNSQAVVSPTSVMGTALITPVASVTRSTALSWISPSSGGQYSVANGNPMSVFKFKRTGLYRVRAVVPGDWQNLAEFCTEIVRFPKSSTLATANPTYSTDVGVDALGNPIGVYSQYYAWRGFKTLDTVGASENCDLALDLDAQVYVADTDDYYSLFIGIRPVASIAENANATLTSSSNSAGIPRLTIEYLGACDGSTSITVIA
jgi:hypothetical protein